MMLMLQYGECDKWKLRNPQHYGDPGTQSWNHRQLFRQRTLIVEVRTYTLHRYPAKKVNGFAILWFCSPFSVLTISFDFPSETAVFRLFLANNLIFSFFRLREKCPLVDSVRVPS